MPAFDTTLTLVGGPTVLIEIGGFRLLTDPTFDPPGAYPRGGVTLEKTSGPALPPEAIGPLDTVLLSHDQHADNLDDAGRALLGTVARTFTTVVGAGRLGGSATGLSPFETVVIEGGDGRRLFVTATPARHGPPGIEPITGEVIGFLLGIEAPGDAVYVSGDTVWYEGVAAIARRFSPRLLILNVGSAQARGAFHVTMDANDALEAAAAFPAATVVGVHTDGWAHFKEDGDALAAAFRALGLADRYVQLAPGAATALRFGDDAVEAVRKDA